MITAKLFKNGNSVVLAIPEVFRTTIGLNAGDEVYLQSFHFPLTDTPPLIIINKAKPATPDTKPHVRQITRKPR